MGILFQLHFFQRNKYCSKSESIYDKDDIHQSKNMSTSQNFITCYFCNLHFVQNVQKLEKNFYV